jgi:GH15 family glucan-1,4-alpha-glucosidase
VKPDAMGEAEDGYKRIEDYGIIGDLHTVALVAMDGAIDWYCYPHFDSPSVFSALLDKAKGGTFQICPDRAATHKQLYLPETNVLITRFLSPEGVAEVLDFMPVEDHPREARHHCIVRRVKVIRGGMSFRMTCRPVFDYARFAPETDVTENRAVFRHKDQALVLHGGVPLKRDGNGAAAAFSLKEGETVSFVLRGLPAGEEPGPPASEGELEKVQNDTVNYWRRWAAHCRYQGRWREMVQRSALVLKLFTYRPTGAMVAAPTASLPEDPGGVRNWDYRYTWIRDASFTVYALLRIGFQEEASRFMDWVQARVAELAPDGSLQPLYGIDGRHTINEEILDHLEGYKKSRPVRIGNDAYRQLQLDIYGALLDAIYLYNKHVQPISHDLWQQVRRILNWVCDHWRLPDDGLWEVRNERRHFVSSKVMCWVALDRGLRLATKRSFPADLDRWVAERDAIYEEVMAKGWNADRGAFVQSYGSDALDAGVLLMPLVFFLSPTDPRMLLTLEAIQRELASDSLVYRYSVDDAPDGLPGREGSFSICSFWLVEALTRAGRLDEARILFEKMLSHANHLGLYAEEIGGAGEARGNYPQAFTHLALISAAYNLDKALNAAR